MFPEIADNYSFIQQTGRYRKTEDKKLYRDQIKIKKLAYKAIYKIQQLILEEYIQ